LNRLDHRDPLVFDTHELGRRPGSLRKVSRTLEAPEGLGIIDVIGVPEKSGMTLELRLESVVEGVLVTGTAEARVEGECVRCLEPVDDEIDVEFQELFYYPESDASHRGRTTGTEDLDEESEDETYRLEAISSTSSRCCVTRWCSHCRCSRCARKTAWACAPNAGHA